MDVTDRTTTLRGKRIAYQTWGRGTLRFLIVPDWTVVGSVSWEHPGALRSWRRYVSIGTCARFDRPGVGASELPDAADPFHPERWADAARAVVDALAWDDVIVVSEGSAGQAALIAASRDPRISKIALVNGFLRLAARGAEAPGISVEDFMALADATTSLWGSGRALAAASPHLAADDAFIEFCARNENAACAREHAAAFARSMAAHDVSEVASRIERPALVVHTGDLPWVSVEHCRTLTDRLPDARLELLPSSTFYGNPRLSEVLQTFALGETPKSSRRRIVMLFTDIVGSTERAAEVGDVRWRSILEDVDAFTRSEVQRSGGRIVTRTGDGCLAAFDDAESAVRAGTGVVRGAPVLGVAVRAGAHVGEVELRDDGDVAGLDVHIASRVADLAGEGEVLLSSTLVGELDPSFAVTERGSYELKGVAGTWRLFSLDP